MAQLSAPPSEEMVLGAELDRPDRALDGIGVDFDAPICEEQAEPLPVTQRIADRFGEGRFGRDAPELGFEPAVHRVDQRSALRLADAGPFIGRAAADARLDLIEFGDPLQRLGGNWRRGGMVEVKELAPDMRPAEGELDRARRPRPAQPVEPGIAVDLQHPGELGEVAPRMHALAVLAVNMSDRGRQ